MLPEFLLEQRLLYYTCSEVPALASGLRTGSTALVLVYKSINRFADMLQWYKKGPTPKDPLLLAVPKTQKKTYCI